MNKEVMLFVTDPFILTIPDESAPFLILKEGTIEFDKFVMENYINFHAFDYQDDSSDGFYLRFENYINWNSFDGFSSLYLPLAYQKNFRNKLAFLLDALNNGYILMCNYDKYYIPNVSDGTHRSHRIIVYGYNLDKQVFFCREFMNRTLKTVDVQFDDMINAISNYSWEGGEYEKGGIVGLKYNNNSNCNISICKLYSSLENLCKKNLIQQANGIEAFGSKALSVFREGIIHYSSLEEQAYRYLYWMNYVRESCKLMEYRINYLSNMNLRYISDKTKDMFAIIKRDIEHVFLKLLKKKYANCYNKDDIKWSGKRCYEIEIEYMRFVACLRNDIYKIVTKDAMDICQTELYRTTKRYNANVSESSS